MALYIVHLPHPQEFVPVDWKVTKSAWRLLGEGLGRGVAYLITTIVMVATQTGKNPRILRSQFMSPQMQLSAPRPWPS